MNPEQLQVCVRFDVDPCPAPEHLKVGISLSAREGQMPIHGVRYQPVGDTTGWYIWGGEYSDADDFSVPLHVEHLSEWCPTAIPYLPLPSGWAFIAEPGYEDVWFDERIRDG